MTSSEQVSMTTAIQVADDDENLLEERLDDADDQPLVSGYDKHTLKLLKILSEPIKKG